MSPRAGEIANVRFGRIAPTLSVADMSAALKFYGNVLGFEKKFENGDPVGFVILKKDDAELHLNVCKRTQGNDAERRAPHGRRCGDALRSLYEERRKNRQGSARRGARPAWLRFLRS